jgi:hypothetical protein
MPRWQFPLLVGFLVVYGVTVVLIGKPTYLIAGFMIAALVVGYGVFNRAVTKRMANRHGSIEDAMSDEREPVPSAHLIPDDETAAGDTPEAHDEINPHDLPPDHPGRQEAERQADERPADEGARTTPGDADPAEAGERRAGRLER